MKDAERNTSISPGPGISHIIDILQYHVIGIEETDLIVFSTDIDYRNL